MLRRILLGIIGMALLATVAIAGQQVTVTLVGGAKITAELLRENDQGIVLDLGHDVLQIPAKRLLGIDRGAEPGGRGIASRSRNFPHGARAG